MKQPPYGERQSRPVEPTDFLIVTALQDELDPIIEVFAAQRVPRGEHLDQYVYYSGTVALDSARAYSVRLVSAQAKGVAPAAAVVTRAISLWAPRYVIMGGIAAGNGRPGQALGDLLVSTLVLDLSETKVMPTKEEIRKHVVNSDSDLLRWLRDWVVRSRQERVHIGPLISQPDVIKSAKRRDQLIQQGYDALGEIPIGIEMEGYGLAVAVETEPRERRPGLLLAKGLVDFANYFKDDAARKQAAFASRHLFGHSRPMNQFVVTSVAGASRWGEVAGLSHLVPPR